MNLKNISVVLVGHGSPNDVSEENCIFHHARVLENRRIFKSVQASFLKQKPCIYETVRNNQDSWLVLVPMLMSEGFIFENLLHNLRKEFNIFFRNFEKSETTGNSKTLFLCKPIGTHDLISEIIKQKVYEVLDSHSTGELILEKDVSLFLAGHGTVKDEKSRLSLEYHVKKLTREKIFKTVCGVYIEEEPLISRAYELACSQYLVVVPFFATRGAHVCEDIPVLLGEDRRNVIKRLDQGLRGFINPTVRNNKFVWLTEPVGCDHRILDIIIRSVIEKICDMENYFGGGF